jgi:hypothetical protein
VVARLTHGLAIEHGNLVGADDHRIPRVGTDRARLLLCTDRARLLLCKPEGGIARRLGSERCLVDFGRCHCKRDTQPLEQLAAVRRRRGEDEHFGTGAGVKRGELT